MNRNRSEAPGNACYVGPSGGEAASYSILAAIWATLTNPPCSARMQSLRRVSHTCPCFLATVMMKFRALSSIASGAPDASAAQGALPVSSHRVERLLGGLLTLQSF
jgi:hypothetical protein